MDTNELYSMEQMHSDQEAVFYRIGDIALHENAKERYDAFKKSIGAWHLYSCKYDYLSYALREDDINSILSEIQEIEKVRNHEKLKNQITRNTLYRDAQRYIGNLNTPLQETKTYDDETMVLMMCVLHENNYFDTWFLPDEVFELGTVPELDKIGEVYGEYFAFYEYLRSKVIAYGPINNLQLLTGRDENLDEAPLTFKEIFTPIHKDKFEKIMDLLCRDLQAKIVNEHKDELERLTKPIIEKEGDNYFINVELRYQISYLAGLYIVCAKKNWLSTHPSNEKLKDAFGKTFNINITSPTAFKNAKSGLLNDKYTRPFEMLLEQVK